MDVEVDFEKMIEYTEDLNIVLSVALAGGIVETSGDTAPVHEVFTRIGATRIRRALENMNDLALGSTKMIDKTLGKLEARLGSKNNGGGDYTEPLQAA